MSNVGKAHDVVNRVLGQEEMYYDSNAGSAYLVGLNADTWYMMLLYSPIKLLYYLFSPLPMNWRGLSDVLAFLLDSSIHLLYFYFILLYMRKNRIKKERGITNRILISIFWCVILSGFVFAISTYTAGTAIRHRDALLGLELVSIGLIFANKEEAYD